MDLYSNASQFAMIKVGGDCIAHQLDELSPALSFLHHVGLRPIVVHGAGPQMNKLLEEQKIEPQYKNGMRVTDAATLGIARKVFREANLQLCSSLGDLGTPARPIVGGVFEAETFDDELGFVGQVTGLDISPIESAIRDGYLPVVTSLAESKSGQILNINADVAARELAIALQPLKIVFINSRGGWYEDDGRKLNTINLSTDYEEMASRDYTGRQGTLLKLNELKYIIDHVPRSSSISLTSTSALAQELFTHKGAGTRVQWGEELNCFTSLDDVDEQKLTEALKHSLGAQTFVDEDGKIVSGKIRPDYISKLRESGRLVKVYATDSYSAVGIVTNGTYVLNDGGGEDEGGERGGDAVQLPYLCKFAATEDALGSGAADGLWDKIRGDFDSLYWRSYTGSDADNWFQARADECYKVKPQGAHQPGWQVFFCGRDSLGLDSLGTSADTDSDATTEALLTSFGETRCLVRNAMSQKRSFYSMEELGLTDVVRGDMPSKQQL
jgi:N-acetyl-gamma-glutamyl-phosphate reductase/acetylglutamate kinase